LGFSIDTSSLIQGLSAVQPLTGLMGRWQTLATSPLTICDTGHNEDGWKEVINNLALTPYQQLHVVMGVMRDKDLSHMLTLLPKTATYYFCHPDFERALPAMHLRQTAQTYGLFGNAYPSIREAVRAAQQ